MSEVKITVHGVGDGIACSLTGKTGADGLVGDGIACSLTGKTGADGLVVTFDDGTVRNAGLSWKALKQLLQMKFAQAKPKALPEAVPVNGAE